MKKFFMFIALFLGIPTFVLQAQQGWSVEIRIEDCIWRSGGQEWVCQLYADLELNGQFVPPSNDYYYFWEHTDVGDPLGCLSTAWQPGNGSGYGKFNIAPDDLVGECHRWRVTVSGVGPGGSPFQVTSPPVDVTKEGTPQRVDTRAKREDGSNLEGNMYLQHWMGHHWRQLTTSLSSYVYLTLDEFETLWATTDLVLNPAEKYNHWNFREDNVLNYQAFYVSQDLNTVTGNFKTIYTATIQTNFYGSSGGEVRFKDPWLPDDTELGGIPRNRATNPAWYTHTSPLTIEPTIQDQYKGVFLNQPFLPGNPYYSIGVAAETTLTVNGKELLWYFERWSGSNANIVLSESNETPVVLTNNNATVTANLKGHLASNSATATAFNNGRRVVVDDEDTWHLVYEDGGNIYYTASTDDGQTWAPETRLSSAVSWGKNRSPAIAHHSSWTEIGVVWDREENGLHFPVFRSKEENQPWTQEFLAESSDQVTSPENCKPVLVHAIFQGTGNFGYFILCRVNSASKTGIGLLRSWNPVKMGGKQEESLTWIDLVPETGENSDYPSITAQNTPSPIIHFAWEENYGIFYSDYDGMSFTSPEEISAPGGDGAAATNQNPSTTYDAIDKVDVVWQHNDGFPTFRHLRGEPGGGNWEPIREVGCGGCHGASIPSIGAYSGSASGELVSTIQVGNYINFLNFDGEEWDLSEDYFPGSNACLSDYGTELNAVWTFHNEGLPYLIKNQVFSPQQELPKGLNWVEKNYRKEIFLLSELSGLNLEGKAELSYGDILIQQASGMQNWRFGRLKDSLNFRNFLQTTPLTITNDMQSLIIPYRVRINDFQLPVNPPALPLLRFRLINSTTGNQLAMLKSINLDTLGGPSFQLQDTLVMELAQFQSKVVMLQMQTLSHLFPQATVKRWQIDIKEFHHVPLPENPVLKNTSQTELHVSLPDEFSISQNYPNPFNPTTIITLSLPEDAPVNLQVYDITGRKVRSLVNKQFPAGVHQIAWDGRNDDSAQVSSGVYIYRVQAGNFIQNRKMVLMR